MSRKSWPQTEATVFTCGVQDHYEPQTGGSQDYLVTFSYEINGHWYSGEFSSAEPWVEGSKFCVRYDPDDPNRSSKDDPVSNRWFTIISILAGIALVILYIWLRQKFWP